MRTTRRPRASLRLDGSRTVGDLYSRMPSAASGARIEHRQIITMPTASSAPNWRIMGTLAK